MKMTTKTKSKVNEYVQGKTEILKEFSSKGYKETTAGNGVRAKATL